MVYKYLLVQIHSSDLFFWAGFIYCVNFFKEKLYGPFLWMGFNCLKATEPLRGGTLLFTTKLPSILSFPEKSLPTIFQFSHIDNKLWCGVLRDLVPFVQFKKREKHSWRSVTFCKDACNFTKSNTPPRVFFTFLKLYKWYQIVQNISI